MQASQSNATLSEKERESSAALSALRAAHEVEVNKLKAELKVQTDKARANHLEAEKWKERAERAIASEEKHKDQAGMCFPV